METNLTKNFLALILLILPTTNSLSQLSKKFEPIDVFDIEYYTNNNQENGYLHKIGTCSLEKVDVTYGGDKLTWHPTTSDGAPPTKTTMTLNFRELRTVTKAAIEQGF